MVTLTITISEELYGRLQAAAGESEMAINDFIVATLVRVFHNVDTSSLDVAALEDGDNREEARQCHT